MEGSREITQNWNRQVMNYSTFYTPKLFKTNVVGIFLLQLLSGIENDPSLLAEMLCSSHLWPSLQRSPHFGLHSTSRSAEG